MPDPIQSSVTARAKAKGLTAYAIARATGGRVSQNSVRRLFYGGTMSTRLLAHVIRVLDADEKIPINWQGDVGGGDFIRSSHS